MRRSRPTAGTRLCGSTWRATGKAAARTYHKRLALQVTLDQAVKELAVEHVERAGFLWNGGLIDNLVVRIDAEDGSVAAAVRRPH